jgi:hypothetical protein
VDVSPRIEVTGGVVILVKILMGIQTVGLYANDFQLIPGMLAG